MVRRHEKTAFMAGAHVFPGGRVDAADREAADPRWCDGIDHAVSQLSDLPPAEAIAHHVAAARELFEEAGVLLARAADGQFVSFAAQSNDARFHKDREELHAGRASLRAIVDREQLRLALDALLFYAHWVTPPVDVRRFDTRFFITRMPPHQSALHDDTETVDSAWTSPADALARAAKQEIFLPVPTWTTLRELEPFRSVDDALGWARLRPIRRREPTVVELDGRELLVLPGDPLHPDPSAHDADDRPRETRFVAVGGRWHPDEGRA